MEFVLAVSGEGPLYRQLFETLREAITSGRLAHGSRLPATRDLAARLCVSRNTVNSAYGMLESEGYVVARAGAGYFVATALPDQPVAAWHANDESRPTHRSLSRRGEVLAKASRTVPKLTGTAFQRGLPALDEFPSRQWQQHVARHSRRSDPRLMKYQDDGGLGELKTALRNYLHVARGVRCSEAQIIVVTGGQAALDLIARMLVDEGDAVAIEDPGYLGARDAFEAAGASIVPVPVDAHGLRVDCLDDAAQLVYATPSYQFPLGVTMAAPRRMALLEWAEVHDAYIVEDDYDSEFRYRGRPLSAMQGLDSGQRVIYMGTFSKVMFPALRLGYLVVPKHLARSFAYALRKTGQDAPLFLQAAMADFITAGQLAAHVRRMRRLYAGRQASFVRLVRQRLGDLLDVHETNAGMQIVCYFKSPVDEAALTASAREAGLDISCLSSYYLGRCRRPGLFLGYAGVAEREMEQAIVALREVLSHCPAPAGQSGPRAADDSATMP